MKFFNKNNMVKKIILTTCVVAISVCLSLALYWYKAYNDRVVPLDFNKNKNISGKDNMKNDGKVQNKNNLKDEKKHVDIKKVEGLTNILLLGTDGRTEGEATRSDTIMILTIDGNHNDIKLSSIERDTYCRAPGLWNQKITETHSNGGRELLIQTIYENFDLFIDKYVEINFEGFKNVAEYLGGIDIYLNNYEEVNELNRVMLLEIAEDPNYSNRKVKNIINRANLLLTRDEEGAPLLKENPYITEDEYSYLCEKVGLIEKEGMNHLNGSQLLAYSRMRHLYPDVSSRTERQKKVIELLIKKLSETSVDKYFGVANEILKYITTNVPLSEALGLAAQAMDINNFDIKKMQIPPEHLSCGLLYPGFNNSFVFLMDEENTTKALHEFIFDDIEFNENKYPQFSYENSKYYVEVPDKNHYDDSESNDDNAKEKEAEDFQNNEDIEKEDTDITEEENQDNDIEKVDNDNKDDIDNSNVNLVDKVENEDSDKNDINKDTEKEEVNKEESKDTTNNDDSSSQENNETMDEKDSDNIDENVNTEENNEQESHNEDERLEEINKIEKDTSEENPNTEEKADNNINDDSGNVEKDNDSNEEEDDIEIDLE